jgi:transcriptional regulator with XRE-family HTH domain
MSTKSPNPIDRHVGSRVRMRRMLIGMSQEKLGQMLGVTFQQVQKYEKGTNRVAAGRLQRVAEVLEVPITFFYEGSETRSSHSGEDTVDAGLEYLQTGGAVRLVRAYARIADPGVRRSLVKLAETMAE